MAGRVVRVRPDEVLIFEGADESFPAAVYADAVELLKDLTGVRALFLFADSGWVPDSGEGA